MKNFNVVHVKFVYPRYFSQIRKRRGRRENHVSLLADSKIAKKSNFFYNDTFVDGKK